MLFEKSEYIERVNKVKESMAVREIEVLIITDPANMCYLSGYDALSFYEAQAVVIAPEFEQPVWIGRLQDYYCAVETTWVDTDNIIAYPDKFLWDTTKRHVMGFIADYLKEHGLDKKVIGVEMDAYYFTAFWYQWLQKSLPNAIFKDATKLVNWIRGIKSEKELEYMSRAARLVEKAMKNAIDKIDVGIRECDVAAGIYSDIISGNAEFGGDYPSLAPIMPSGKRTSGAHLTWTDKKYQDNQIVYMEMSGCYRRYHAPLTRTIYVGKAPQKVHDTAAIVVEGLNTALELAKPGVTCEEIERVWQKTINKYGLEKESRMGYAVGLSYPPVWCEDTAFFKPGEKIELKPNMTFHMMPGMWLDGYGIAITETFRITEKGSETITKFPRKLFVK
ncbi:MAG: ectoine hydrolase DoeA [Desulfitibacter sp. BRH_c19]|nr:MAG: ectoine hydrolase DoeA [Desulfitibacter sp. BRH_c19]